jgi:hypothetical protein
MLLAISVACSAPGPPLGLHFEDGAGRLKEALVVDLRSEDDSESGGAGAVALTISFENISTETLSGCQLGLGDTGEASFSDLEVYGGFFVGNKPRGRPDLRPGETAVFAFNHDNNNYGLGLAPNEAKAFTAGIPRILRVACGERRAKWRIDA